MSPTAQLRWIIPLLLTAAVVGVVAELCGAAASPAIVAAWALGAAAAIGAAGALLRRWNWIDPLARLGQAARRMAGGDWNVRVQPHGSIPMRRMAADLNALAAQAQRQLSDLQQQRGGQQILVDTLPDPILAADAQGKIILLNAPAAQLLSLLPEQALNQKLIGVVSDEQIVELYEAVSRSARPPVGPLSREIQLVRNGQRQTYQAVATRTTGGGALLVLRDVSTLAGAMQMKTDFVANASHELRTPITAIKIAFETLREVYREDVGQTERCILVIDGHLKRLEEMLRDLLDLSRVESPDLQPHVALAKTADLLGVLRSAMGALARQKNIELQLGDEPQTPAEIHTDSRLFNLVLKNLVENSIKFTPTGGKVTVTIRRSSAPAADAGDGAAKGGPGIVLAVADTGIGIAPEFIDRVFERFYQVDSARSGTAGRGTGLGLAIVKHAVHALGGTVGLESQLGVGTTVRCEFPQPSSEPTSKPAPIVPRSAVA
jgi:two-component system phosphate regulon sensor histidine kinase PhoR